ncbi:peptidase inhibitor 16-like [Odontesthes bonariensis]|uniref:peptidase inhibitor 16-like n=1 Tax=Odontesthes bonariensis TaxID=219752 RepID=UPI003F58772E
MHQRSRSELRGASAPRTARDGASWWSSRPRMEPAGLCPPRGAQVWAWLLLGVLLLPGARSFLTEEQEELLVELHNHYRGLVSPSASAMLPLKWDPNLKVVAEGYAAKCIWNHNPELEDTGENLFAGTGPLDLREALEKWFLENLKYDYQNNSCHEDEMCGHYTQMVWAGTHKVGCAFHLCDSMEGLGWDRVSFLVCNYYPAGNYEDERPYIEGDWCSSCPENLLKCENNLCVPDRVEEDNEDEEEATADPSLQPPEAVSPETVQSASAASIPGDVSTAGSEDTPPPGTTAEAADPAGVPSATPGREEEAERDSEDQVEEKREESTNRKVETWEILKPKIVTKNQVSAGSASTAPVLLACLTGLLTAWV